MVESGEQRSDLQNVERDWKAVEDKELSQMTDKQKMQYYALKSKCEEFLKDKIPDTSLHPRYLAADGLRRLLVARDYKNEKSFEMFKKWVDWRLSFKVDQIDVEEIRVHLQTEKIILHKEDKLGRLCVLVRPRYHDPGSSDLDVMIRYGMFLIEKAIQQSEGKGNEKIVVIYDRSGFEKKNFDNKIMTFAKKFVSLLQDYYAERLACFYIVNANWFFKLMYGVIKPFLTQRTKDKMIIIGKQEDFFKYFEPENLLPEHGGTSDFIYDPHALYGLKNLNAVEGGQFKDCE